MFEHHSEPLLPRRKFLLRLGRFAAAALVMVAVSWVIGILGYRLLEGMGWIDAILNSAMILGGMGPVNPLHTNAGKLFASFYALFSGVIFIASSGLLVAPLFHRLLHNFHVEPSDRDNDDSDDEQEEQAEESGTG